MATVAPDAMSPGAHGERHTGAPLATNAKEEGQGGLKPWLTPRMVDAPLGSIDQLS